MSRTYCVAEAEVFGALNSIDLSKLVLPAHCKSKYYLYKDGNYLALKVTKRQNCYTRLWYIIINQRFKFSKNSYIRYHRYVIGCLSDTSLENARQKCSKILNYIRENNRLPRFMKDTIKPTIFFNDGTTKKVSSIYSVHKAVCISSEDIFQLHAYESSKGKFYSAGDNLSIFVREKADHTSRHYAYCYETSVGTYRKKFSSSLSIPYSLARKVTEELNAKISSVPYAHRNQYITSYIQNRLDQYNNTSVKVLHQLNERQIIHLSDDAINKIFEQSKSLFPVKTLDNRVGNGYITFGILLQAWFNWWSKTVEDSSVKNVKYTLTRYIRCFSDKNVCTIINDGTLQSYLITLYCASPCVGYSIFKILRRIIDFGVVLQIIRYNPLSALKLIIKKPSAKHYKTLDPFNLSAAITSFFAQHGSILPLRSRVFIELLFCTLLRPGELARASFYDIRDTDLYEGKILHLPKTKTKNEFEVPITQYTMDLLKLWLKLSKRKGSEFLFPNAKNPRKHFSTKVINKQMKKAGCSYLHLHGIRSCGANYFAIHCKEIPYEVGVACLNHTYTTASHSCYDRTRMFIPRIDAMKVWSEFLKKHIGKYSVLTHAEELLRD